MVDSRALRTNTPPSLHKMQKFVYKPLLPVLKLIMGPTLRTAAPAGVDVVELTLNPKYKAKRGYYTLLEEDESSPDSQNREKQSKLWAQTPIWAKITENNTALQDGVRVQRWYLMPRSSTSARISLVLVSPWPPHMVATRFSQWILIHRVISTSQRFQLSCFQCLEKRSSTFCIGQFFHHVIQTALSSLLASLQPHPVNLFQFAKRTTEE